MVQFTDTGPYPGQSREIRSTHRTADRSSYAHRQFIGYIGLVLPAFLVVLVLSRDGIAIWRTLDSISAYYYTGAVSAFVGMLVALALFLLTYRGYESKYNWADRAAGVTAGIAALGVALFPTKAPDGLPQLSWWHEATGIIHYASATVLFLMFALYALWLFRLSHGAESMSPAKRRRNAIYLLCGIVIVACIVWAGIVGLSGGSIFIPESIALFAFAVSWLVKGYAHRTIGNIARKMIGWRRKTAV